MNRAGHVDVSDDLAHGVTVRLCVLAGPVLLLLRAAELAVLAVASTADADVGGERCGHALILPCAAA
jgi:hypothetical protein